MGFTLVLDQFYFFVQSSLVKSAQISHHCFIIDDVVTRSDMSNTTWRSPMNSGAFPTRRIAMAASFATWRSFSIFKCNKLQHWNELLSEQWPFSTQNNHPELVWRNQQNHGYLIEATYIYPWCIYIGINSWHYLQLNFRAYHLYTCIY